MFSHELEYIFNKEYREWYDALINSLNKDAFLKLSDLMLSGHPLGSYTISEIKKICKKNKKEIRLHYLHNLSFLSPEEVNSLYSKIIKYFIINFKYKGQIIIY